MTRSSYTARLAERTRCAPSRWGPTHHAATYSTTPNIYGQPEFGTTTTDTRPMSRDEMMRSMMQNHGS